MDRHHDWNYDDIITALRLKGYSLRRIGQELGLTYPAVRYQVRTGSTEEIRNLISRVLAVPPWRIYSSRFPPQWRESGPPGDE